MPESLRSVQASGNQIASWNSGLTGWSESDASLNSHVDTPGSGSDGCYIGHVSWRNGEGRDGENRPDRGGQRAEYEALSRSVGSARLSDLGHIKWFRGARSRAQDAPRSDPDGYPASAGLRSRSDAVDQG